MVNVIDNGARNRANMMPVGIKVIDDKGNVAYTAKTDLGTNYISLESKWFGSSSNNTGGSTGGNTGGSTGGDSGGNTGGGTAPSQVSQLPSTVNLFSGSAVGNILLSGPSTNYDNVQDGLLIALGNITSGNLDESQSGDLNYRMDLSPASLNGIKIPKEKLVVNNSFDISDQLSQYIGKKVQSQFYDGQSKTWTNTSYVNGFSIVSFGGTTINVLSNTTLNMNLTVSVKEDSQYGSNSYNLKIPVIQVNDYKN